MYIVCYIKPMLHGGYAWAIDVAIGIHLGRFFYMEGDFYNEKGLSPIEKIPSMLKNAPIF